MGIGKVYLVGAGPGAADLITLRGWRAINEADVLICDNLLPRSFIEDLGIKSAKKLVNWLAKGYDHPTQTEINTMMYDAAKRGKIVARIKTGDPFIFGRGNEETEFLSAHDIPWEVIPALSVCTAGPSVSGLSLTSRRKGRSFAAVTARCAGGSVNTSYPRADSLVIFMGVSALEEVVGHLFKDGWRKDAPAVILERTTMIWERRVEGYLSEIPAIARRNKISSPAVLVVGAAVFLPHTRGARPRILFTGLDPANFRTLGDVLHWPALKVVRDEDGYASLPSVIENLARKDYDLVIFTSKVGVRTFFDALGERRLDARVFSGAKIAVAGSGTASALRQQGIIADYIPDEPGSEGIMAAIGNIPYSNILVIQGGHAPKDLLSELKRVYRKVFRLSLHRVIAHPELGRPLPEHDVIYFTSPSGARAYWDVYGREAFQKDVWCIGSHTLAQINKLGINGKVVNPYVSPNENAKVSAQ